LPLDRVVPPTGTAHGNFLTFALPWAAEVEAALIEHRVSVDRRADRLRFGFGVYHDDDFIDPLLDRVRLALSTINPFDSTPQ
jgi:kynureninase